MNLLRKPHHKKNLFSQHVDMLHGPLVRSMIIFMVPMLLSALLQSLFSAADIAVVGNYSGKEAVAAVGASAVIISFIVNVSISLSTGVNIILSRAIGMNDEARIKRTVGTTAVLSLSLGVSVALLGALLTEPLLLLTGCPENIRAAAALYLRVYLIGVPATMFYNFMSPLITLNGDSTRPFVYLAISGVTNVVLNLVFVAVFGMGVFGVALATVISLYLSAILLLIRVTQIEGACRFLPRNFAFSLYTLRKILQYGIPSSISCAASVVASMYIQTIVNSYGDVGISGNTAASSIEAFMFSTFGVLGAAIPAFLGQSIGAGDRKRSIRVVRIGLLMTLTVGLLFSSVALLFGRPLLSIYLPDSPEALEFGLVRLKRIMALGVFCSVTYVTMAIMNSFGHTLYQMICDLTFTCVLRVLWLAFVYPKAPKIEMLYVVYPLAWILVCLVSGTVSVVVLFRYKRGGEVNL